MISSSNIKIIPFIAALFTMFILLPLAGALASDKPVITTLPPHKVIRDENIYEFEGRETLIVYDRKTHKEEFHAIGSNEFYARSSFFNLNAKKIATVSLFNYQSKNLQIETVATNLSCNKIYPYYLEITSGVAKSEKIIIEFFKESRVINFSDSQNCPMTKGVQKISTHSVSRGCSFAPLKDERILCLVGRTSYIIFHENFFSSSADYDNRNFRILDIEKILGLKAIVQGNIQDSQEFSDRVKKVQEQLKGGN